MLKLFQRIISTSFAPNVEPDDVYIALKQIVFSCLNSENKKPIKEIKDWFCNFYQTRHCYLFSSGRAALYYLLKALGIEPGSEIIVQALTCVAVPNSIIWNGLKPIYVDVDKTSLNLDVADLEKKISTKTKAIIIQHTFGIPADIKAINKIAAKHKLLLIEDCAHCLGGEYQGGKLGSFGDVSFFSFGRDKMVSSVFGGAIVTKNISLAKKLSYYENKLTTAPKSFVLKQLLYNPVYFLGLLLYPVLIGKLIIKSSFHFNLLSKAVFDEEKRGSMPAFINFQFSWHLGALILNQLSKIDKNIFHRRQISEVYRKSVKTTGFGDKDTVFLRYPTITSKKNEVLAYAKHNNIHLGDWYRTPIAPIRDKFADYYYYLGVCPNAENIAQKIINLPTHINISVQDANKICSFINSLGTKLENGY